MIKMIYSVIGAGLILTLLAFPTDVVRNSEADNGTNNVAASAQFSAVNVYPNPWNARHPTAGITFAGLPPGSTVKLFTVSAEWLRTLQESGGRAQWDLLNSHNESVASGVYLYLIQAPDNATSRGKVIVIR